MRIEYTRTDTAPRRKQMTDSTIVLEVKNLDRYFYQDSGLVSKLLGNEEKIIKAVDGVSFSLRDDEVHGVIGESGCGKTTLLMSLMKLYEPTGGTITYQGRNLSELDKHEIQGFRGNVQAIFQDPFNSFDPKLTIRESLQEPLKIHGIDDQENRVYNMLDRVELNPPERYLDRVPGQLSGGELQRAAIARALVIEPEILLADEPVSMLDVSTQASILNLLSEISDDMGLSVIYISHDLSTVSYICDRISVMYLGRIVEQAPTMDLIKDPQHPYTEELINAVPIPDPHEKRKRTQIEGNAPDPINLGDGCRFRDRCPDRMDICEETPKNVQVGADRQVACHLYYDHGSTEGEEVTNK